MPISETESAYKPIIYGQQTPIGSGQKEPSITTTSNNYMGLDEVVIVDNISLNYPVFYVDESIRDLESLIDVMQKRQVRVSIVNVRHRIFEEVIHNDDICTWFSACREGLFFYIPYLVQSDGVKKQIISFDNDSEMVSRAQKMCYATNVKVCKAMAHCVCSSVQLNESRTKLLVEVGDECLFVFPPEAYHLRNELNRDAHMFSRHAIIYFTHSKEEFKYWLLSKKIDINALHTLLCACAYVSGYEKEVNMDEISKMCFGDILSYDSIYPMISREHRLLYELYLSSMAYEYGDDFCLHAYRMKRFVDGLFNSKVEIVKRGIDFMSCGYNPKLADHIPILKSTGDEEVIRILGKFESLL